MVVIDYKLYFIILYVDIFNFLFKVPMKHIQLQEMFHDQEN